MQAFKIGAYVQYTKHKALVTAKITYITVHGILFLDNGQRVKQTEVNLKD